MIQSVNSRKHEIIKKKKKKLIIKIDTPVNLELTVGHTGVGHFTLVETKNTINFVKWTIEMELVMK